MEQELARSLGDQGGAWLAADLTAHHGRGFSERNLEQMRQFYVLWPISQTVSAKSARRIPQTASAKSPQTGLLPASRAAERFTLSWSHYVRLVSVTDDHARRFYEAESLRGGWSVRQLDRQISTLFYERTALSKDKATMLTKGAKPKPEDGMAPDEEVKDPFLLEFLNLKDEYSESDLEEALLRHLESFLLELGTDFTFVGRQRRLRIGDEWYCQGRGKCSQVGRGQMQPL
jgi:predicted nuclease of restriction endonuclease-like (RecB) superfamily